jgi:hypothetical protein
MLSNKVYTAKMGLWKKLKTSERKKLYQKKKNAKRHRKM